MSTPSIKNLNDSSPTLASGYQNAKWQQGATSGNDPVTGYPIFPVSAEVPNSGGISNLTSNATAATGDCGKLLTFALSGIATYTLPATPPSVPDGSGTNRWHVDVQSEPSSSAALTIAATSPAKLDGVTGGSLSLGTGAGLRIFTDGTDYRTQRGNSTPGGPYPSTGAAAISQSTTPSTLNVSTEGVYDWLAPCTFQGIPRAKAWPPPNSKATGGWLLETFCWTSGASMVTFSGAIPALTSVRADDTSAALSGFSNGVAIQASTDTGEGFFFRMPADTYQRVLRIYTGVFSGVMTVTGVASDGSFSTVVTTLTAAPAASAVTVVKIVYNTARDGQHLNVTVRLTTNSGSTPNISCQAVTLAAS